MKINLLVIQAQYNDYYSINMTQEISSRLFHHEIFMPELCQPVRSSVGRASKLLDKSIGICGLVYAPMNIELPSSMDFWQGIKDLH